LQLVKSRRRDPRALSYGTYWLIEPSTNAVVLHQHTLSRHDEIVGLSLDDVENYLNRYPSECPRRRGNGPGAGHGGLSSMPEPNDSDEPTVRELLLTRIDEHCRLLHLELDQAAKACGQLAPARARSCRNAITTASVMVDEIRLRAHARR
jgi:hypothetical protein